MDPFTIINTSIAVYSTLYSVFSYLSIIKGIANSDIISTYFNWNGNIKEGNRKIEINKHFIGDDKMSWFYSVKPIEDYTFIRIPLASSGIHELLGYIQDEENSNREYPDYLYWRWIAIPHPNVIVDGKFTPPNVRVDFIIIGYKPKAIIKHFS